MSLIVRQLRWESVHGDSVQRIVDDISLRIDAGELVGLIGPNGSGKSTVLRMIYRVLRPSAGLVSLGSENIWQRSARANAREMAVLAQDNSADFDFSVGEMVAMGRTPHKSAFARDDDTDAAIIARAMARTGVSRLAERSFATLSGGEKQRVLMARALAQQARLLVLDEPTNHLDIRHQFEIMNLVRSLGVSTIAALHELHIAAHYCDRLYVLQDGYIVCSGHPAEVLTPELLARVYGVHARVRLRPDNGRPLIEFIPDAKP